MRPVSHVAPSAWSLQAGVEERGWGGGERLGWARWHPTAQRGPPPVCCKARRVAKGIVKHSQRFLKDRMPIKFHHFKVTCRWKFHKQSQNIWLLVVSHWCLSNLIGFVV